MLHAIAKDCGAVVIEDAAHALGAYYGPRPIGALSDFTCFSFYPTKTITGIEGGAVIAADAAAADRIRIMANHGMSVSAWARHGGPLPPRESEAGSNLPQCVAPGYKYNLADVNAALALSQISRLQDFVARREQVTRLYDELLAGLGGMQVVTHEPPADFPRGTRSSYHLFTVLLEDVDSAGRCRDRVGALLRADGIGTGVHYISLHLQPFYRDKYGLKPEDLPVANQVSHRLLSLPLHSRMNEADVDTVVKSVERALFSRQAAQRVEIP